jgi:hypothetical protein
MGLFLGPLLHWSIPTVSAPVKIHVSKCRNDKIKLKIKNKKQILILISYFNLIFLLWLYSII